MENIMADLNTKLYASQGNGGSPSVSIDDIGNVLGSTASPATTSTLGVVKQSTTVAASAAAVPSDAPAGGTGATAGAYDTSAHRDAAIVTINELVTLTAELQTTVNAILSALKTAGTMA
jgi:hypothetical protein